MTSLYDRIIAFVNHGTDERTADWPLIDSPMPLLVISISYLYFVLKCGPDYMRDRKPYQLKTVITVYNLAQVFACGYIFYELMASGWWNDYSLGCQPLDRSRSPKAMRMANTLWWLMLLKLAEFLETVFFVLRKKFSQITRLHLYHHISTLVVAWVCTKYTPGGMTSFPPLPNMLVHIVMYSYYLVSLHAGDELQKKLNKWKRYLTILQMVQFCVMIGHIMQGLNPNCDVNKYVVGAFMPNVFLVFYLFYDFYKKAYTAKSRS